MEEARIGGVGVQGQERRTAVIQPALGDLAEIGHRLALEGEGRQVHGGQAVDLQAAGLAAGHSITLDAEGLQRWLTPHLDGYAVLRQAADQQGFFRQALAKSA